MPNISGNQCFLIASPLATEEPDLVGNRGGDCLGYLKNTSACGAGDGTGLDAADINSLIVALKGLVDEANIEDCDLDTILARSVIALNNPTLSDIQQKITDGDILPGESFIFEGEKYVYHGNTTQHNALYPNSGIYNYDAQLFINADDLTTILTDAHSDIMKIVRFENGDLIDIPDGNFNGQELTLYFFDEGSLRTEAFLQINSKGVSRRGVDHRITYHHNQKSLGETIPVRKGESITLRWNGIAGSGGDDVWLCVNHNYRLWRRFDALGTFDETDTGRVSISIPGMMFSANSFTDVDLPIRLADSNYNINFDVRSDETNIANIRQNVLSTSTMAGATDTTQRITVANVLGTDVFSKISITDAVIDYGSLVP